MQTKLHRNETLECCRILAAVFVVFLHVPFPGLLGKTVNCLARFAVPLFFAISGAELHISVLPTVGVIGAAYIIFRVFGKLAGSYIGCKLSKAPATVCKYLGPTLIPQAGVAIGLTLVAQTVVPEYAPQIRAIVLCATLVYEMVGPAITKITLTKAGEIPKA